MWIKNGSDIYDLPSFMDDYQKSFRDKVTEKNGEDTKSKSSTQSDDTTITTVIKPKWESDYLTAPKGYIKYEGEDGRLTKETWCDLNPKQLGINMNNRRN